MTGARHSTDGVSEAGESETPYSYGPNPKVLMQRMKAHAADQDMGKRTIMKEPKPGKELDFN